MNVVQSRTWLELTKDEFFEIAQLRCEVFYVEQRVSVQDYDAADRAPSTTHYFMQDETGVYAYMRTLELSEPEFGAVRSLGRMAVRADRRGQGLATQLLDVALAAWGSEPVLIHAQEYVTKLYEPMGFVVVGEPFDEAGIAHRSMLRRPLGFEAGKR